jgi:osmotically-inducible protein OsmY
MPRVRRGAGTSPRRLAVSADSEITARIRHALTSDATLRLRDIHITVLRRWVSLLGRVFSESERDRAMQAALRVSGVRRVIDHLDVR